ncbi:pyridoxal-phosphate dependent enzyme [Streptomyces sp. NPDC046985]|uniref:pyridoxal-phosphate dependent enzyme n=1 Tax=Streptomyces sp. NPDC046985 TaxID=3155377 RepID=UPI0034098C16
MLYDDVRDAIGHTPLLRLRHPDWRPEVEVYAKLEFQNLFAMKDRVARHILLSARRRGDLRPGAPVIESSSGTMALGVALVGRSLGHPVHIVTDPRIDPVTRAKLDTLGCTVHVVEAMTGHGWQSARLELLEQLLRTLPGAFWPQQYSNPDNPAAYRSLAGELLADLPEFTTLIGAVGSGGSLTGTARGLRDRLPGLRVVGVDCVGSALFGQPDWPQRAQSGLGNSLLPKNLDRSLIDEVHWLNDKEAFDATRRLAAEQALFAGNTSGSVYAVLGHLARTSPPGTRLVGIMPDRGDRYVDSVHSEEFWRDRRIDAMPVRQEPSRVDLDQVVSAWSYTDDPLPVDTPRALFVESNTTGTGMDAFAAAAGLGLLPTLLTRDPSRYQVPDGCEVVECDTNDASALRHTVVERFRREAIRCVTTTSDFYVPAVADLAGWLGLPGPDAAAVRTCRRKHLSRAVLTRAGCRQPAFTTVSAGDDLDTALAGLSFPRVVKPSDESGSQGVLLVPDADQARRHLADLLAVRHNARGQAAAGVALVEEYLDGQEVSVETFGHAGETHVIGLTLKTVSAAPHFVELGHRFPAELPPPTQEAVLDEVRAALSACGLAHGPAHTEVKLTAAGPVVVEINPRLAGGRIPTLIRYATGIDLIDQQVRQAAGHRPDLTPSRALCAGIRFLTAPASGTLERITGEAEALAVPGVERVDLTVSPGATVSAPTHALQRIGSIIATGRTRADVDHALDLAMKEMTVHVR